MTWSHERCSSDMQRRQQITWCWSAFKAFVIKRLDELEKSALLEMQTASQDSISQMEREESELENSVSWHDLITWTVLFWHAASTANYMMLVTKNVHNKVRMFWTFCLCCQYFIVPESTKTFLLPRGV
jgi:hypothetical protein